MVARHYYRAVDGTLEEQTARILVEGWETRENAEEGSVGSTTITIGDPNMELDYSGHRGWLIVESDSESDDDVIFSGYTGTQITSRGEDPQTYEPIGRVWSVELYDMNTLWSRRVMTGADCKRPAETDVERMQWLLATNEATPWFSDITTYVSTSAPVNVDAVDYRGQMFNAIADDCAQASGKNWFVANINDGVTRHITAFYGDYTYDSPLSLSNDPGDWLDADLADGTSLVWPISGDTKLHRDPSRVFSGDYLPYDGGAVYRTNSATETAFAIGGRDMISPALNVKSKAKAIARAIRYLADADSQDERITTTVRLPKGKATMIRAGMMVRLKASHLPGYESLRFMRVLNCTPKPVAAGAYYDIALELQGPGTAAPSCSTSMANATSTTLDEPQPAASGTLSLAVSPTYAGPTVLIPVFSVTSGNPGNSIGAFSGGFSTLEYDNTTQVGVALRIGFQQGTAPATFTAGAAWTAYGDGGNLAVHAAIPSSGSAPVQDNYQTGGGGTGLVSAPTPGNIVVMVCHAWGNQVITGPTVPGPVTGWTLIGSVSNTGTLPVPPYNGINRASLAVYARCVQAGEDGTYSIAISGGFPASKAVYLSEWTAS